MKREARPYLHDISEAAARLSNMIANKTLDDYVGNDLLRSAVERQLIVIGEALYQLRMYFPDLARRIPDSHRFITFRHVLVHSYNQVEPEVGWGLMETGLERMRQTADRILVGGEAEK